MSYAVYLTTDRGDGPEVVAEAGNVTSNVAPVWRHVGADIAEFDGKRASDCLEVVKRAEMLLSAAPRSFDHLVRGTGPSTVESAIRFLGKLAHAFREYPGATVVVEW